MIDWHWEVFFYYKLKRWGCELTVSQTPTFIIEPLLKSLLKVHISIKEQIKNYKIIDKKDLV